MPFTNAINESPTNGKPGPYLENCFLELGDATLP